MKVSGLLAAVAVLAVLGGLVWWSNKKTATDEKKPAADASPKILTIAEDQFQGVAIRKANADATVLKKADKWRIEQPKPLAADQDTVSSLVSTLSSLSSDRLIEDKASDLSPYGLSKPSLEVTITKKDGKSQKLLLGDKTATENAVYAKLDDDPRIFTVATFVQTNLDKTAKDLRDKRLLTFDSDKLTRVELDSKSEKVEFGKNNQNEWQILKPKPLRADSSQVEELIRKLKDAKMDTSGTDEDAAKATKEFASGTRVGVAAVTDAAGTQQIEVKQTGKDKDKTYYAKSSVLEGVYKVPADLGEGLGKTLPDFRNKKLFDFGWNDPSKIVAAAATYTKSGEKWMSGAKQMDGPSVQALIDKLRDLASIKFVDSGAGATVFDAAVTSNDGKRVEKVTITKQGDSYFARRENEPSIYELDGKAVEELQKVASDVKEYQPPKDEKKKK